MKKYKTEQENFWSSEFGNDYILRNKGEKKLASKVKMFSDVISKTVDIKNCLELGANIGLNLEAISLLKPEVAIAGVEINPVAAQECRNVKGAEVFEESILDFSTERKWDFVFTAGVLIHINPNCLNKVYDILYNNSNKYIFIAEYYNPSPVNITYRGNDDRLFKRDFAGELLDKYSDLKLIDYGFVYNRDNNFPGDDLTWFLMEKK